jgi:ABC-type transporter Mla MlaB component
MYRQASPERKLEEALALPVETDPGAAACAERRLDLGKSLTIAEVGPLKSALADLLASPGPLGLDAGRVERADTAGIQLLLSFCREAERRRLKVSWGSASNSLIITASRLGLSQALGLNPI